MALAFWSIAAPVWIWNVLTEESTVIDQSSSVPTLLATPSSMKSSQIPLTALPSRALRGLYGWNDPV